MATKSKKAVEEEVVYEGVDTYEPEMADTIESDENLKTEDTKVRNSPGYTYETEAPVPDNELLVLSREISNGVATQDAQGLALQALQVSMGVSVIENVGHLSQQADAFTNIAQTMSNTIAENTMAELPMMDTDSIIDRYGKIQDFQQKVAAFKHKVATGAPMFGNHNMSEDERMVLRLVQSFPNAEIRMKFMEMVERFQEEYMPTDTDQFEDETLSSDAVDTFGE